jgi:PAS domain S-box-containing protein
MHQVGSPPQEVLTTIPDGYCVLDSKWRFIDVDSAAAEHLGRPGQTLIGRNIWAETRITPDSPVYANFHEAVTHQRRIRFETESAIRPGVWFEVHVHPRRDGGLDVFFHEVTERRRADERLRESEKRFRDLAEASFEALVVHADGVILDVNTRVAEMFGYQPADLIDKAFWGFIDSKHHSRVAENVAAGTSGVYELEVIHKDGRRVTTEVMGRPITWHGRQARVTALRDITARKRAEEALEESEERLRMAQEGGRIGAFEWNLVTGVNTWTPELERIYGLPVGTFGKTQRSWEALLHPEDRAAAVARVAHAFETGNPEEAEFRIVWPDGSVRWLSGRWQVFRDGQGKALRLSGVNIDITTQKQTEAALRAANAALADADSRKDEFIALLSHELRNPLAPIRYALPILNAQHLDDSGTRAMAVINRQTGQMTRLLDDLLDIGRITSGKLVLRREQVTLRSVVNAAIEAATPALSAANHALKIGLPAEHVWLDADGARLTQVITNLLDNSAKFTPSGGEITVQATREGDEAVISVQDTGVGIPEDALPHVFEMFTQVERPGRLDRGLGIGLTIAKRLIDMHGGTIEASSPGVGQGARFLVRVPVAPQVKPEKPAALLENSRATNRRLRVLVVDDNVDFVEMVSLIVETAGHAVQKAFDGSGAISTARAWHPDVVLLDLGLPVMSGIEVAQALRKDPNTADARLIALTGWGQPEDREKTRAAGFQFHLTKPTEPEELCQLLEAVGAESPWSPERG